MYESTEKEDFFYKFVVKRTNTVRTSFLRKDTLQRIENEETTVLYIPGTRMRRFLAHSTVTYVTVQVHGITENSLLSWKFCQ